MRMKPYPNRDGKRVWLSTKEVSDLINEYDTEPRPRIAIRLAARCGLRRTEITEITPSDLVTSETGSYHLRIWESVAKHDHYREPPVPDTLASEINTVAQMASVDDSEPIIDVADKTIYRWVRRAAERRQETTGDDGWEYVDVHDLRRSWGTHVLSEGVLPSVVMSWGGWDDWDTFREHYLGEFSPAVLEREREKVDYLASGDPIEADSTSLNAAPPASGAQYSND